MSWLTCFPIFFTLFVFLVDCKTSINCVDEDNKSVDWFYIYKLPKNKFSKNLLIKNGIAYMYVTSDTIKNGWTLSQKSINDTDSIPGLTLNHLYETPSDDFINVIYNDQPPINNMVSSKNLNDSVSMKTPKRKRRRKIKTTGGGHTKGVISSDSENGIWLIHSVPKFPPLPEAENSVHTSSYSYPETGTRFGQSFLCLSLKSEMMNEIGVQLSYNEPRIVHSRVPDNIRDDFKSIISVIQNNTVNSSPWSHISIITTRNGMNFKSFAKSGNFKDDIYEALIAQSLKSDLLVETWINGPGVLKSNCSFEYKVNNINKIAYSDKNIAFSSHNDHSKWAITIPRNEKDDDYWTCVGDINRAESQEYRGGGSVCIKNYIIWKIYDELVNDVEPCIFSLK